MKLSVYSEELFSSLIDEYVLTNLHHTDTPQNIIQKVKADQDQFAIAISDDSGNLVGFFCLHLGKGPELYGFFGRKYALIRGFSIDERYRNRGYASESLLDIFELTKREISERITNIVLAVNEQNIAAQKAYEKSGFKRKEKTFEGRLGRLIIMEKCKV